MTGKWKRWVGHNVCPCYPDLPIPPPPPPFRIMFLNDASTMGNVFFILCQKLRLFFPPLKDAVLFHLRWSLIQQKSLKNSFLGIYPEHLTHTSEGSGKSDREGAEKYHLVRTLVWVGSSELVTKEAELLPHRSRLKLLKALEDGVMAHGLKWRG